MPSESFSFTGSEQTYTVPSGVDRIAVEANGAGGGDGDGVTPGSGATGGRTVASGVPVTPGETLSIYVGGSGQDDANGGDGGFNGGGVSGDDGGAGGGGATDVRQGGSSLSDRIVVAGGGGGGGGTTIADGGQFAGDGGSGDAPSANDGGDSSQAGGGGGGTQDAGGAAGTSPRDTSAEDGSFGAGGAGGFKFGGGAGGGWYGGGGGGSGDDSTTSAGGGGGGGSSYATSSAESTSFSTSGNGGDGSLTITYVSPPENLTAAAGFRSVDLDWDAVSGADEYNVYRDGTQVATVTTTTYTDSGLDPTTTYDYYVTAVDGPAESDPSDTTTTTTGGDAPTDLSATAASTDQIDLSWTGTAETKDGYEIHRATESGVDTAGTPIDTVADGTESYTDTGLAEGTEYHYRVVAVLDGERGEDSNEAAATTVLPAPTDLTTSAVGDASVDLAWTANHTSGETRVDLAEDDDGNWSEATTVDYTVESVTLSGLLNGQLYGVRVVAQTTDAESVDQ